MPEPSSNQDSYLDQETIEGGNANESANTGDEAAATPTADKEDAEGPKSILEAVQAAVEPKSDQEQSSGSDEGKEKPEGADGGAEAVKAKEAEAGKDPFDDPSLPFHKHPRWQELRGQLKNITQERDTFKSGHDAFVNMTSFVEQAGLSREEVNEGFEIMRLMKHEPENALKKILPHVATLRTFLGQVDDNDLPNDLREKVDNGYLDDESAKEIALLRARQANTEQASQTARAAAVRQQVGETAQAVDAWERRWQASDPDYEKKHRRVEERFELAIMKAGGFMPRAKAIELLETIRKDVDGEFASIMPKPREIRRPQGGDGNSTGAAPQPKSLIEAMQQAVRQTNAA